MCAYVCACIHTNLHAYITLTSCLSQEGQKIDTVATEYVQYTYMCVYLHMYACTQICAHDKTQHRCHRSCYTCKHVHGCMYGPCLYVWQVTHACASSCSYSCFHCTHKLCLKFPLPFSSLLLSSFLSLCIFFLHVPR